MLTTPPPHRLSGRLFYERGLLTTRVHSRNIVLNVCWIGTYHSNLIHYCSLMMMRPYHILTLIEPMSAWPLCKQGPSPFDANQIDKMNSPFVVDQYYVTFLIHSLLLLYLLFGPRIKLVALHTKADNNEINVVFICVSINLWFWLSFNFRRCSIFSNDPSVNRNQFEQAVVR